MPFKTITPKNTNQLRDLLTRKYRGGLYPLIFLLKFVFLETSWCCVEIGKKMTICINDAAGVSVLSGPYSGIQLVLE